jgi:tetratricopeptide (TPR) repeat protein
MAKARRVGVTRNSKKKPARPAAPARARADAATSPPLKRAGQPIQAKPIQAKPIQAKPAQAAPTPPARKPAYYEAIALYESGVRGLQRHDYDVAAAAFRSVLERYPDERELHERARLYLRVCERETARRPAAPQTPQERVYAATVALNAGDHATAMEHLRRALEESPDSDHAHYIMAVALAAQGAVDASLEHLRQAVTLNPENRALARQDPDLDNVRDHEGFRDLIDSPAAASRRRPRVRR